MKNIEDLRPNQTHFLGYWETLDYRQWGVAENLSEKGLRIHSHLDLPVGGQMKINVFFSIGNGFVGFPILTRIAQKNFPWSGGFQDGYEYELEFADVSEKDVRNLRASYQNLVSNKKACS